MIKSAYSTKRNLGDLGLNVASQRKRNNHNKVKAALSPAQYQSWLFWLWTQGQCKRTVSSSALLTPVLLSWNWNKTVSWPGDPLEEQHCKRKAHRLGHAPSLLPNIISLHFSSYFHSLKVECSWNSTHNRRSHSTPLPQNSFSKITSGKLWIRQNVSGIWIHKSLQQPLKPRTGFFPRRSHD